MNRYLLFRGQHYYPSGGWRDFGGSYDSTAQCLDAYTEWLTRSGAQSYDRWAHVVDTAIGWTPILEHSGREAVGWSPYRRNDEDDT